MIIDEEIIAKKVVITENSIKAKLKDHEKNPSKCLLEYVWNSLDAKANIIDINYKLPEGGLGNIEYIEITDNGEGFTFKENPNIENFLDSTKKKTHSKNKTLPKGQNGIGRYAYLFIAKDIEIYSDSKKLSFIFNDGNPTYETITTTDKQIGTKVRLIEPNDSLKSLLFATKELKKHFRLEFCWLIKQNPQFKIKINGEEIGCSENIKDSVVLRKQDFSDEIKSQLDDSFCVELILWKEKPAEYSSFYFLDKDGNEIFKKGTSLNKKSDDFWHSVYIISDVFSDGDEKADAQNQQVFNIEQKKKNKLKSQIKKEIKERLVKLRKPYLIERAEVEIYSLEQDKLLPNLSEFGIYDPQSYNDLLKTIYTISPSLFNKKHDNEKKFICSIFAGLLSSQDNHLIQVILEQLGQLTEEEKEDLKNILERTTLSNVVRTIKEVDHRLEVLKTLKELISDYKKQTLEINIQRILDENFWIFGEQFRLFSTTEGALKNTLLQYAKEILQIENPHLNTDPKGEVDLFLTKTEESNNIQRNIIVELKRPSIILSEEKEYLQIKKYCNKIIEQALCNGINQYWEFYLIGTNYDRTIEDLIKSQKGEKQRGLVHSPEERIKIYVRKWSDILEVEWGNKMKFLKEKLEVQSRNEKYSNVNDLTNSVLNKKLPVQKQNNT